MEKMKSTWREPIDKLAESLQLAKWSAKYDSSTKTVCTKSMITLTGVDLRSYYSYSSEETGEETKMTGLENRNVKPQVRWQCLCPATKDTGEKVERSNGHSWPAIHRFLHQTTCSMHSFPKQ